GRRQSGGWRRAGAPGRAGGPHPGAAAGEAGWPGGGLPRADSASLAAQLLGTLTTPSQAAIKAETRLLVQEALNGMDPVDREVLALKHFEQLSTAEIAEVLGLSKAGAGSRYLRAIKRLRAILEKMRGFEAF